MAYFKNVTTLEELRRQYKELLKIHHPDNGGNLEVMQGINAEYIPIGNLCLDSANDNYPTYELLQKWKITPFIDLNTNRGRPASIPDSITIDTDGTPLCNAGHRMVCWGYDKGNSTSSSMN